MSVLHDVGMSPGLSSSIRGVEATLYLANKRLRVVSCWFVIVGRYKCVLGG